MAISKHQKAPDKPNAAAFVGLIDDGLADPAVVSRAYQAALREWQRGISYARLLAMSVDGGVVQDRSEIPWDAEPENFQGSFRSLTPEARLTALDRAALFDEHIERDKGGLDARPLGR